MVPKAKKRRKRISNDWAKLNRPPDGAAFGWLTKEMIESPAWRYIDIHCRRALDRIWLEHMDHAATANGRLVVTDTNFREYGVRSDSVTDAIEILEALGWIDIPMRGRPSFEDE